MRVTLLVVLFMGTGCWATHTIQVETQPSGAEISLNGEAKGVSPLTLTFESRMAEKIWPTDTTIVSKIPGATWSLETKTWKRFEKYPNPIIINHKQIGPLEPPKPKEDDDDPYKTLEESKGGPG